MEKNLDMRKKGYYSDVIVVAVVAVVVAAVVVVASVHFLIAEALFLLDLRCVAGLVNKRMWI